MNRKNYLILISALIVLILFYLLLIRRDSAERKKSVVTLLGTEEEYGDQENLSFWAEHTGSTADCDNENDLPYRVIIKNTENLAEFGLPIESNNLYYYLEYYLDYYTDFDRWHVTIQKNSFVNDMNFPYFYVTVEELPDISIKCIYSTCEKTYDFKCSKIEK